MRPLLLLVLFAITLPGRAAEPFAIRDGDRVLFLGDTLLEREGTYGYLETRMHAQFPERKFTVRNLAFSADTPRGWSRASFDPAEKGWERLQEQIATVRPTVVFLGYGMAASLQEMTDRSGDPTLNPDPARYGRRGGGGEKGGPGTGEPEPMSAGRFKRELGELMDAINAADAANKVRFVLLSPIRHEDLRATRPGLPDPAPHNLLLEQYSKALEELAQERGARFIPSRWPQAVDLLLRAATSNGIHLNEEGYQAWALGVGGSLDWSVPKVAIDSAVSSPRDSLRAAIIRKNELFFHQWRPANSTYLFGFRKHEQGQNAREMPMFDPLIEAAEAEIDRLKRVGTGEAQKAPSRAQGPIFTEENGAGKRVGTAQPRLETAGPGIGIAQTRPKTPVPSLGIAQTRAEMTNPSLGANKTPLPQATPSLGTDKTPPVPAIPALLPGQTDGKKAAPSRAPGAADLAAAPPLPRPDFTVAEGYQIDLWAENPLLYKPTQMNWDADGRLWVASSALYPQIEPGAAPTDTILILEDTDRDGRADKSAVFAEGLLIPTAVQPNIIQDPDKRGHYGCYVGQSTELLYFEDTDGDGRADRKQIILSGFGTEDTHHILHTLRRGPDRRLYFNQSVYIHSHLETPWGVLRVNSGAVLAWDPCTEKVEVFSKGLWNTWGHAFDRWGQSFQTDGAGSTGLTWSFPGATFAPFEGARRTFQSISPGSYPKFCGLELISSPHFPADWQGNAVTCDFRAHRIVRFGLTDLAQSEKPQAGYTTTELPDIVRTSDVTFRPIDVKLGPDGALYIADWSNPVINHGEVDFRDPRRDKTHGRIWRVTKKDAPLAAWQPLSGQANPALLDLLLSENLWAKEQARNLLGQRLVRHIESRKTAARATGHLTLGAAADDSLSEVEAWLAQDRTGDRLREVALLESSFATIAWARFPALAASPDPRHHALVPRLTLGLRSRGANRLAPLAATPPPATRAPPPERNLWSLPKHATSSHPRVRLEAIRALGRLPVVQSYNLILNAAVKNAAAPAADPFLEYAAWLSINDLAQPWTAAIASGAWKIEGREKQLEYGLAAIDPALAGKTLAGLLEGQKIALTKGPWIELLGRAGSPRELSALLDSLIISFGSHCCPGRDEHHPAATALSEDLGLRILAALLDAARTRSVHPDGELTLAGLVPTSPEKFRPGLLTLAGLWKTRDALPLLSAAALGAHDPQRVAAIEGLRALGGAEAIQVLESLCDKAQPFGIRRTALTSLAAVKLGAATKFIPAILHDAPNENEVLATWRGVLAAQGAAGALAKLVAEGSWAKDLPPANLAAGVKAAREGGKKTQALLAALAPLHGTLLPPSAPADYADLAMRAKRDGDPARGEQIYRRATSACVVCHEIGGAGGLVGPSLTSLGASAPLDYIIESMLAPGAKVKEGYNAVTFKLKDGTEATGIAARETASEVILRNVAGQETAVPKASITGKTDVGSIMPAGLLEQYKDRERLDLFAFLGELGKPGPFDASKGSVARAWRLYSGAEEKRALAHDTTNLPARLYTNVDGRASAEMLAEVLPQLGEAGRDFYATAQFQVAQAGKVRLHLTGIRTAWLDGQPLAIASEPNPSPDLAPGLHTLAVKLDRTALPAILRAAAEGANFLGN